MAEALKGSKPALKVSNIHLRTKSHPPSPLQDGPPSLDEDGPSWLPPPDDSKMRCHVTLAIVDHMAERETVFMDYRLGDVLKVDQARGAPTFEVKLADTFSVPVDTFTTPRSESSGTESWSWQGEQRFAIEVRIQCQTPNDTAKLLSYIDDSLGDVSSKTTSHESLLARWTLLPELPGPGQLFSLMLAKDRNRVQLPYGAAITMNWNEEISPLATAGRALMLQRGEPRQLPTPVSDDLEVLRRTCFIKYLWQDGAQIHRFDVKGFSCALCPHGSEYLSFERLRLHLLTHHNHFRFEADESDAPGGDTRTIRILAFEEHQQSKDDETEFGWQAPEKPFDVAAHLNGNTAWIPQPLRAGNMTADKAKTVKEASSQRPPGAAREKRKLPSPVDVEDLGPQKRRKHRIPDVPGINFYRTTSKQKILPGTVLSDSDEEPDVEWRVQSQRRDLTKLGLDDISQDFNALFNKHLDLERPTSDRLTRDAIVRFARKFAAKLCESKWREKFHAKLEQMESRRIFGNDTTVYCMALLNEAAEKRGAGPEVRNDRNMSTRWPNGEIPESPAAAHSAHRVRWKDGRIISTEEDESRPYRQTSPSSTSQREHDRFGKRKVICSRPTATLNSTEMPIRRMTKHGVPEDKKELEPSDIGYDRFIDGLRDDPFRFGQGEFERDILVCIVNDFRLPITNDKDLHEALALAHNETTGTIYFEVLSRDELYQENHAQHYLMSEEATEHATPRPRGKGKGRWYEPGRTREPETPPEPERPTEPEITPEPERPTEPERLTRPKNRPCICEKRVEGLRRAIACQNPRCGRVFHMDCLGLDKRPPEWRCGDCA
ncbi:hypothetical protein DOTSEDRAFT_50839 [Lecanosticta acicola]|uniref:Zinc finger PHD-type domain-containing protein n=1 Tax=Lecanosticta acicola TaxID=111012 RepID=A0AAI8Z980_9PEZI|nr:hypothetical protein DOTSEDRAFT_50839 [Lecanosticta acicola]